MTTMTSPNPSQVVRRVPARFDVGAAPLDTAASAPLTWPTGDDAPAPVPSPAPAPGPAPVPSPAPVLSPAPRPHSRGARVLVGLVAAAVVLGLGVALWGGYTQGWDWTGVTDKDTLWHWMQLLMVPIAFATLPLVLKEHGKMRTERKLLLLGLLIAFVALVIAGYAVPLQWTGFTGQTLWDWLSLLLLPMAVTSVRFLHAERKLGFFHYATLAVIIAGFGVLIAFGYMAPWDWTGFTGNTLLDWVQLLFLPIVFPTVVVPAAAKWLTASRERAELKAEAKAAAGHAAESPSRLAKA